ncbi:hypothetical protein H4582DRAFT_2129352 [Lactarius indigo]|nr:hypothetical protein H4582DRAFT_2129352 [Lactarius indigo]
MTKTKRSSAMMQSVDSTWKEAPSRERELPPNLMINSEVLHLFSVIRDKVVTGNKTLSKKKKKRWVNVKSKGETTRRSNGKGYEEDPTARKRTHILYRQQATYGVFKFARGSPDVTALGMRPIREISYQNSTGKSLLVPVHPQWSPVVSIAVNARGKSNGSPSAEFKPGLDWATLMLALLALNTPDPCEIFVVRMLRDRPARTGPGPEPKGIGGSGRVTSKAAHGYRSILEKAVVVATREFFDSASGKKTGHETQATVTIPNALRISLIRNVYAMCYIAACLSMWDDKRLVARDEASLAGPPSMLSA